MFPSNPSSRRCSDVFSGHAASGRMAVPSPAFPESMPSRRQCRKDRGEISRRHAALFSRQKGLCSGRTSRIREISCEKFPSTSYATPWRAWLWKPAAACPNPLWPPCTVPEHANFRPQGATCSTSSSKTPILQRRKTSPSARTRGLPWSLPKSGRKCTSRAAFLKTP